MSEKEFQYIFFGRIHPSIQSYIESEVGIIPRDMEKDKPARAKIIIFDNILKIELNTNEEMNKENKNNFRNNMLYVIRSIIQQKGFIHAKYFDAEIIGAISGDKSKKFEFDEDIPILRNVKEKEKEISNSFNLLYRKQECADYLQRCLSHLSKAIKYAEETGLFCYLGIESIKQYFFTEELKFTEEDEKRTENKDKVWGELRNKLNIERKDIDYVKSFADGRRHGGNVIMTDEERAKIFKITWEIVDKFIVYITKEKQVTSL